MLHNTTVSFPGLGIEEFTISRVAFSIFGKPVFWYGVIITIGMLCAFIHAYLRTKRERITTDDILDVGLWTVFIGVLGARLYYVLTTFKKGIYENFIDVIAIWDGGLAIYGGVIGGALAILFVTRYKKINTLKVMDCIAPGVMLAQAIGRWGNFMNGEAFGEVVSENSLLYPFRMGLVSDYTGPTMQYYHPTFLYESVWNIVGFILITCFYKKKKFNGQMLLSYLAWYGFGRMFIEGLRTDSLYVGPFRISQVVGAACFVCGTAAMIVLWILSRNGMFPEWLAVEWRKSAACGDVLLCDAPERVKETSNVASAAQAGESDSKAFDTDIPAAPSEDTLPPDADASGNEEPNHYE